MSNEEIHAIVYIPYFFMQMISTYNLLYLRYSKKISKIIIFSSFTVLGIIYSIVLFTKGIYFAINYSIIIFTIPEIVFLIIISKFRDGRLIFSYFFCTTVLSVFDYISYMICFSIFPKMDFVFLISRLILITIPFLFFNFFYIPRIKGLLLFDEVKWNLVGFISLIAGLYVYYEVVFKGPLLNRREDFFSISLVFFLLIIIFFILLKVMKRCQTLWENKQEIQLLQLEHKQTLSFYNEILQSQKNLRFLRHDLNRHLATVENLLEHDKVDEAKIYIEEIEKIKGETNNIIFCNNSIINALICYLYQQMEEKSIKFMYKIKIDNLVEKDSMNLCIILGNILENAIEACEDGSKIDFFCIQKKQQIYVSVKNTSKNTLTKNKNGLFLSNKSDKTNHGLGTQIISSIIQSTKGWFEFSSKDNTFCFNAIYNSTKV